MFSTATIAGPFPTIAFAMQIATGEKPALSGMMSEESFAVSGSCARCSMPDPETRNPSACQGKGGIISQSFSNTADKATDRDALQASRIVRLYAVTFATAATIARLAYAVAR